MKHLSVLTVFSLSLVMGSCTKKSEQSMERKSNHLFLGEKVRQFSFGKLSDGTEISLFRLANSKGMEMEVINYGGIIVSLTAPDKDGNFQNVVLGYDSLAAYEDDASYFGALIGRYANRIARGRFSLNGKEYRLSQNNMGNHLHGGVKGFHKVFWKIEEELTPEGAAVKLTYSSDDMEEGYPGNLNVTVTYILTNNNELKISYQAVTDKMTVVNLMHHGYFNLTGDHAKNILGHQLMLNADKFLPVDETLIPLGEVADVAGTPFDFRRLLPIGSRINESHLQLQRGKGYDHCWILKATGENAIDQARLAAEVYEPISGRVMKVYTTEPGIQFYSGNWLDGSIRGKSGIIYQYRSGICLETEHFPNSPNTHNFPSVVLSPGETYSSTTIYAFSTSE